MPSPSPTLETLLAELRELRGVVNELNSKLAALTEMMNGKRKK